MLLALTILISTPVWSQGNWRAIAPLEYCERFQIEYQVTSDGQYRLRIPGSNGPSVFPQTLQNINDLSSLTDILVEESAKVCSDEGTQITIENNSVVIKEQTPYHTRECSTPVVYSEPYLDLAKELVKILQLSGNRCDQLMAYTELQTKITQLSDQDLIQLKSPSNLFHNAIKLFTGKETGKLVDLYATCGGEKFTDKFVANLILIEAKNSCVMPKPPGLFTFDQAKKIAEDVAKDYNGLSLMDINSKKDEITQKAAQALAQNGIRNEVSSLLGPHVNVDTFLEELDSFKELKATNIPKADPDYLSLGFGFDATLEVAKKALPVLAKASFEDKLPDNWSAERRKVYLGGVLIPQLNKEYASCMREHHEKSGFGKDLKTRMSMRSKLKANYCQKNPEQCDNSSCEDKINIISGSSNIADSKVAQGCVMKSMLGGIKNMIHLGIVSQKEAFAESFILTDDMANALTKKAWKRLVNCANRRVQKSDSRTFEKYDPPEESPVFTNPRLLQSIEPKEFETVLIECANSAEVSVAKEFYAHTLLNEPSLSALYPESSEKLESLIVTRQSAHSEQRRVTPLERTVEAILNKAYDPCIAKQHHKARLEGARGVTRNPMLCVPGVEIATASKVIQRTLSDLYKDNNVLDGKEAQKSLETFEACVDESIKSSINNLSVKENETPTPINTDEDANNYLKTNHEFYSCVKDAVTDATSIVGDAQFDSTIAQAAEQLSDPAYPQTLKKHAVDQVQACFKQRLDALGTWRTFTAFNDAGGIAKLEAQCSGKAVDHVLPRIMVHETQGQLAALKAEKLIKDDKQIDKIISQSSLALAKKYKLKLPKKLSGDALKYWIFAQAHNEHIKSKGNNTDTFINEFTQETMGHALGGLHSNLKQETQKLAGNKYDDFFDALNPSCLHKLYSNFEGDIEALTQKMDQASQGKTSKEPSAPLMDQITEAMLQGLRYQKGLGQKAYQGALQDIQRACAIVDANTTPRKLAATGAFDFILKGVIKDKIYASFDQVATDQCSEDLIAYTGKKFTSDIQELCSLRDPILMNKAFEDFEKKLGSSIFSLPANSDSPLSWLVTKVGAKRNFSFIKERHFEMLKLINTRLAKPEYLEKTVFNERPSRVLSNIYDNFSKVLMDDPLYMPKLEKEITAKLFDYRDRGSFADEFTRLQVTNGLGLGGYEQASKAINMQTVEGSVGWFKDMVVNKNKVIKVGKEALKQKWTPKGINRLMAWRALEKEQRLKLIDSLYKNAVEPTLSGAPSKTDLLTDEIGKHASEYVYTKDRKTFEQRLTDEIVEHVENNSSSVLGWE